MSVCTHATSTSTARTVHRRHFARAGTSVAGLALTLLLTGCFDRGGEPTPEPSQTITATESPSDTPTDSGSATATVPATASATATASAAAPATATGSTDPESSASTTAPAGASGELPSADLQRSDHEGAPRRLEDIFHLECIHALDGKDVPQMEDAEVAEGDKPAWSVMDLEALTDGWKSCPVMMYGRIAIPAVFSVEATPGGGTIDRLRIFDAQGRQVGGVGVDVAHAAAPEGAELVEVVEVSEARPSPAYGEEVPYLRSLVVKTGSGHQLMVDLVSAPAGADPETLEVWDLAAFGGGSRHLVYASIPLSSPEDAAEAAGSELHAVLRSMVGSYTLPVH